MRPEVFGTHYVTKVGFISRKQRDMIVIEGEDEKYTVYLDDVECTFPPRLYDQVSFVCKVQRDLKLMNEAGFTIEVTEVKPNIIKRIVGKITHLEPDAYGVIAEKYLFFWEEKASDYRIVNIGDLVAAECIQCERCDESVYEWRCLKVVLDESVIQFNCESFDLPTKSKDTENRNGIEITDDIVVEFNETDQTKPFIMVVKNTNQVPIQVLESVFLGNKRDSQLKLISPGRNDSFFLEPNGEKEYKFEARSSQFGDVFERFFIKFQAPAPIGRFKIFRYIKISVHDAEQKHPFAGTGATSHKNLSYTQRVSRRDNSRTIPGVPLQRSANFVKTKFQQWNVPQKLMSVVLEPKCSRNFISETLDTVLPFLKVGAFFFFFRLIFFLKQCVTLCWLTQFVTSSHFCIDFFLSLFFRKVLTSRTTAECFIIYFTWKSVKCFIVCANMTRKRSSNEKENIYR